MTTEDISRVVARVIALNSSALAASRALNYAGGKVYAVGGVVRDVVLGIDPHDVDMVVTGLPHERVQEILEICCRHVNYEGADFGVFRVKDSYSGCEIALPRRDYDRLMVVEDHTLTIEQDLSRRDYTCNAMAVELFGDCDLIDRFDAVTDIENQELKVIGNWSLRQDPLRTMRGLVLFARFGLWPSHDTYQQMVEHGPMIEGLSRERIMMELDKLMESADPADGIRLAHDTGLLGYFLPEVERCFGFDQNNPHHELELGEHTLSVLSRITPLTSDKDVRMAALLHDVGKPQSAWTDPRTGSSHFYRGRMPIQNFGLTGGWTDTGPLVGENHEEIGAQLAHWRLHELRWSTSRRVRVARLVLNHMFAPFTTATGARRFLSKQGALADDLLLIRRADSGGKRDSANQAAVDQMEALVAWVRAGEQAFTLAQLAVNGNDLIELGYRPGPAIGSMLKVLLKMVIDTPSLNTRETLIAHVQDITRRANDPVHVTDWTDHLRDDRRLT